MDEQEEKLARQSEAQRILREYEAGERPFSWEVWRAYWETTDE